MKKILDKPYEKDEYFKKWLVGLTPPNKEKLQQRIPRMVRLHRHDADGAD